MNKYPTVIDFNSVTDLCEETINNVENEDEYTVCTIVANNKLAVELINKFLAIKGTFHVVSDNKIDHIGYYYVTITSDFELFCQPICYDGKCMWDESEYTYIQECVPWKFEKYFGDKWKIIFGISE